MAKTMKVHEILLEAGESKAHVRPNRSVAGARRGAPVDPRQIRKSRQKIISSTFRAFSRLSPIAKTTRAEVRARAAHGPEEIDN
ncbi:hypothetical protein EVAR_6647_1 [Eumeta japonica]|uniref:Uncharacterized protein n=1 Tax=Eumeta variegata TaxID=151549 RepID=A0A4C1TMT7_EUMVA|nr:hypothetical protein EVAR_6647_1 [Eumeta japonica]